MRDAQQGGNGGLVEESKNQQ